MTITDFLSRFETRTESGGQWLVQCPAHADRKASLAVREGDSGRIVINCHAGCTAGAIVAAMNLSMSDLFSDRKRGRDDLVATYNYEDEAGHLLYQVTRFFPKNFRQRRPDGNGGWVWSLDGVRRVIYHLPDLPGHEVVYVAEGEKDVDNLRTLGLAATTNAGGASRQPDKPKWIPEYTQQLVEAGVKCVVILPDNDDPGRAHAEAVARSCHAAGLKVKVVALPGLQPKSDVSDWLNSGHTKDELVAQVKATALYEPAPVSEPHASPIPGVQGGLNLTALSDLMAEPDEVVEWLVADRIPRGSVVLLAGKPKAGKSTLARDLALQVANGGSWLTAACALGPVWYLAFEDKRSEVKRHFRQMGASGTEPVRFLFQHPGEDILGEIQRLAEVERPALIVVDTLQRLIRARDLNDYAEVTTRLTPVLTLARETGAAVVLVHHAGKGDRAGIDAVLGSTALAGSVDNILIYSRTEQYRLLSSVQRIGPDLPETVVTLDADSGRVGLGLTRIETDVAEMERAIMAVVSASPEPLERKDIEERTEGKTTIKRKALQNLVNRAELTRTGAGKRNDPYLFSCSLVPTYMREQETTKPKSAATPHEQDTNSCSREKPKSETSANLWEQETEEVEL